jgi:drug/metabolite transporter (DMT)-like permease
MLRVRRRKILGAMAALIGAVLVVLAIVSAPEYQSIWTKQQYTGYWRRRGIAQC